MLRFRFDFCGDFGFGSGGFFTFRFFELKFLALERDYFFLPNPKLIFFFLAGRPPTLRRLRIA